MAHENLNKSIIKTLESYFKAFYPLVYIYSHEEDRVETYLENVCEKLKLNLFTWDLIDGFTKATGGKLEKISDSEMDYADYENCFSFIGKDGNDKSVFLLKDFHPAFALQSADRIVRKIRNVIVSIRASSKIIALLVPPNCEKQSTPKELEKEIVIYRFPLPTYDEGLFLFDQVISESFQGKIKMTLKPQEKERMVKASLGLTANEMDNAFIRAAVTNKNSFTPESIDMILEEKKQIIEKSGILEYFNTDTTVTDVGGLEGLKQWLQDNLAMFDKKAQEQGCEPPKGILLAGVPGCGKSLTVKTLASFWKMPLLRFDLGAVFGGLVGESEANMRRALEVAESVAPCVLWVDEIEKGLSGMTSAASGDSGTSQRVFGTLMSWMQERKAPVFFIATANDISRISTNSPELLRSGRFDEIFFIDLPNETERGEIFKIHLQKRKENPENFQINKLAGMTSGYSGSDIEQIVKDGKRKSYIAGTGLTQEILGEVVHNRLPVGVTMKTNIEFMRKWASTHARLASNNENEEPIESIDEYEKKKVKVRKIID